MDSCKNNVNEDFFANCLKELHNKTRDHENDIECWDMCNDRVKMNRIYNKYLGNFDIICKSSDIRERYSAEFFLEYMKNFKNQFSFDELKNLTISAKDLLKCKAKIHLRNDTKVFNSDNFFERFDVLESIYGKDFGIYYKFFAKNYSIFLKDDDFIEIMLNYKTQ